jgi:hypothetical protein
MTAHEYLKVVSVTIASLGHRDNNNFISAATIANQSLQVGFSDDVTKLQAERCRDALAKGLETFGPHHAWFSAMRVLSTLAWWPNTTRSPLSQK